jgi:hypothetical protein
MTSFRVLPVEEWEKVRTICDQHGFDLPLPKTDQGIIIVAEDEGKLIGCVGAERSWNVNPIWITPEHRGNGLAQQMVERIEGINGEDLSAFLVTSNPHVELLVHRLGFIPLKGQLWRRG